jgi:hypothetical protein
MKRLDQKKLRWPESHCCSPPSFAIYIKTDVSCSISIPYSNCFDPWPVCQREPDVAELDFPFLLRPAEDSPWLRY